jgi:long-subunit fatty acid transport protein
MKVNTEYFKKLGFIGLFLGLIGSTQAQYLEDGIRFSQSDIGGTARFKAMGGAQTALGGDPSSIAGNPAGLGFYNNSDASLSLDFLNDFNKSTYFSTSTDRQKNRLGLEQAGVLLHLPIHKPYGNNMQSGWLNFNIGISYNKTQNFNTSIDFNGVNDISSYTDMLADESPFIDTNFPNYPDFNNVYDEWGFDSYLVDNNGQYFYPTTSTIFSNNQGNTDFRTGSQYETNIAFGANYGNQFYIGASVGIAGFHYESNRRFTELGAMKNATEFNEIDPNSIFLNPNNEAYSFLDEDYELAFSSQQITDGSGVNATLGMIFLPHRMWRIGLSATTPTWYKVRDDYSMYLDSWIVDKNTDNELFNYASPKENYYDEYDLRTPYKLNLGVAALFEEGLITADLEFVDYASMRINQESNTEDIKGLYQAALNFRLGGEYIFSPQLLARAGYNYQGNPYKNHESTRQIVSAGLGYRVHNVYVDLAYQNQLYKYEYTPYQSTVNPTESANINNTRNNVLLTLGVKF